MVKANAFKETYMRDMAKWLMVLGFGVLTACSHERPSDYGDQRPAVDKLDDRDSGLQSKDVVTASEQMTRDLLASPNLRQSPVQWTVVVTQLEDRTLDRQFNTNYDIFLARLKTNLAIHGQGQVQLLDNRRKTQELRSKELDGVGGDEFQQGAGPVGMGRMQPNYALHGKVYDMPNRGTNYYLLEFDITDLRTGAIVWANRYEVKVAR